MQHIYEDIKTASPLVAKLTIKFFSNILFPVFLLIVNRTITLSSYN